MKSFMPVGLLTLFAMCGTLTLQAQDSELEASVDSTMQVVVDSVERDNVAPAPQLTLLPKTEEPQSYKPHHGMDLRMFKSVTNPGTRPYTFLEDQTWVGIPLFVSGIIAKSEKNAFRQNYKNPNTKIRLIKYNFHNEIDNYTQFVPLVATFAMKLGGVEGRSDWPRLWASAALSSAIMAGFVNGIKYTASELRPDGSTRNSWPSGHTATAFMAATIFHKEYGLTRSPWYSVGAFSLATATGVMRVLNNRHWISDVLSGAGIGILSVELGYGICDLLFKGRGLLRNDMTVYPDLRQKPSFFAVSMGAGFGSRDLTLPPFQFDIPQELFDEAPEEEITEEDFEDDGDESLKLRFRTATAVGAEGAWFFNPYVGIGGRLRVKSSPIKGWSKFALSEESELKDFVNDPLMADVVSNIALTIESDHITEFAFDAGVYFSLPLSSRFALGSKLLLGRSVMSDLDVRGSLRCKEMEFDEQKFFEEKDDYLTVKDNDVDYDWDYINVSATNSMKLGTGLSVTYAYKNNFCWRLFCDYDYSRKTFKASYNPMAFFEVAAPDIVSAMNTIGWDITKPAVSSRRKSLHQWVFGGALCVSF
ncbi:MAG: phosphatase PAP2 family protein [Muribaculaceae bacterium]|nr:phosphatase PAP2 family protein [Muribaculaceae bacterium]